MAVKIARDSKPPHLASATRARITKNSRKVRGEHHLILTLSTPQVLRDTYLLYHFCESPCRHVNRSRPFDPSNSAFLLEKGDIEQAIHHEDGTVSEPNRERVMKTQRGGRDQGNMLSQVSIRQFLVTERQDIAKIEIEKKVNGCAANDHVKRRARSFDV